MSIKNNCYICNAFSAMIMAYKKNPFTNYFLLLIFNQKKSDILFLNKFTYVY